MNNRESVNNKMSDRHKYRAFDKRTNKMIYNIERGDQNNSFHEFFAYDCYVPMQCTSFKDRNDKLAYDGDVYHLNGGTYQIMFVGGAWVGGKNERSCCPLCWEIDEDGYELEICKDITDAEIIGNIHENPELLEETNE